MERIRLAIFCYSFQNYVQIKILTVNIRKLISHEFHLATNDATCMIGLNINYPVAKSTIRSRSE